MKFHQEVPPQQQNKDFKVQPSRVPATPAKAVPTQRPFVPSNGQKNHKSSQDAVSIDCLASSSDNARPTMLTYDPAEAGWRWTPGTNPMDWNDMTAESRHPFLTLLLQSQIGDGVGTPVHQNQLLNGKVFLNPSLSNEKTITVGVTDAMPSSSTPETMEKNKFLQECLHQEVTDLVQERVMGGHALENESGKWQPPAAKQVNICFSELMLPTSSESMVLTSSASLTPSSSEFAVPSQVLPSKQEQNEVRVGISSEQDAQLLNVETHKQENQGIDLNRTPQQKPKRRKHRPKVIQECKPAGTPKPRTPKPLTRKVAKIDEASPTGKRKYVRKKMGQSSSDAPSSVLVDIVDPDGTNRGKSVRRRLNFDSELLETRDACPGPAMASMHYAQPQTLDSCLQGTINSSSTKSTMQCARQSEAVVENPGSGMTFDLNDSVNQMPYEYIRSSENPNSTPQLCTGEKLTTNQILDCHESTTEKFSTPKSSKSKLAGDNLSEIAKNNNYLKNTGDRSQETGKIQADSNGISIMMLKGTKRDHNVVQDAQVSDCRDSMHAHGGSNQLSECHDRSVHDLHLAMRSKKKRTENKQNGFRSNTSLDGVYMAPQNWRANHIVLNHALVALEEQQLLEQILAFDKIEKLRSDVTAQSHESNSVSSTPDFIHTTTPLEQSGYSHTGIHQLSRPVKPIRGSDSQGSEIFEPQKWEDAHLVSTNSKTKPKRRAQKEQSQLANPQSSSTNQVGLRGHMTVLCNFDYPPVEKIPDSTALVLGDPRENISHPRTSSECQDDSSFQKSTGYNLMSGAIKPYGDPLDDLAKKIKHITITETHEDARAKAENALVPYDRGGVIVPYNRQFDLAKKRHPRPKVDLDAETFREWNLLMGKGGNDGMEEKDIEKEKRWEEERKVFHGRVNSFIARMHLVQGDRRFCKWKGSVVDSVVGVFLTQNVSDHLSSSAYMALAARFPSSSRGNNAEPHGDKRGIYMELQERCIASLDYSSKLQDRMLSKELYYLGSQVTENESSSSIESFGSNTRGDIADCSRKCIDKHEEVFGQKSPHKSLGIPVILTGSTSLAEAEDRWSLDDVASSQNSVVSSQNSSENQVQTTDWIELNSLSNFQVEDLMTGSMSNGIVPSTSFVELLQMAERIQPEQFQGGIGQFGHSVLEKKFPILDLSCNLAMSTAPSMPHCFNKSSRCGLVDMGSSNVVSDESRLKQLSDASEMTNTNGDKIFDASVDPSAVTATEVIVQQKLAIIPENKPEDDSYASISKCFLQPVTSSETEACIRKQFFHHNNFQKEEIQKYSHVQVEGTVQIQQKENAKFQTESTDRIQNQMQNFGNQQSFPNLYNKQRIPLEVFEGVESILDNKSCNLQKVPTETTEGGLKENKVKVMKERNGTYDWDILKKESHQNGTRKERTSDTMDSLDWESVRCAEVHEISETIRERGMNNMLAERIKDFLNRLVKDHGSIDLEWLRDIEPDKAKDYLLSIRGLGLKSVECVRLLTLQQLAFPVDTNVGRICVRLGWVPLQPLPESLQLHLLELYPVLETIQKYLWPRLCKLDQRTLYELHYQMITFGKVFCTKSKPNCNACPMRAECKHFACAYASARLALPGPEEKILVSSTMPIASEINRTPDLQLVHLLQLEVNRDSKERIYYNSCEPIIEEPSTPKAELVETEESAIEDIFYEDPDEIPIIKLNFEEFTQNLQSYMQEQILEVKDGDMSKALVVLNPEAASIPMPKLKNVSRLRTEHHVYELPDSHPLLEGLGQREPDDPSSYLLALWTPGETAQSTEPPEAFCNSQEMGKLCNKTTCFACNSIREAEAQTVRGTILIPCRTAMRGSFPLNGTYFQVNEVFADHDTSRNPIDVPREWIWNLPRRTVYFGTSIPTIFKGLTTQEIQQCFWRGFVCVRGFDRTTRAPKPLYARLHFPASKAPRNKKASAAATRKE